MFFLKQQNGALFYLQNLKEYTVGRRTCDLLIENDQSISRLHAKIVLKNRKPILIDNGSKYGTTVNNQKIIPKTEVELKKGDEVHFGQLQSVYEVDEMTIITTTSTIKGDQKKILTNNISQLGGSLQSNWSVYCTHVTVEEILLTVKVLCAVIKGVPIVTPKYWEDYVNKVKERLPPPDVKDYKPVCSEATLGKNVVFDFKPERLTLFKNKIFVFPTKNDKAKMIDMIRLAGGDAISWDVNPFTTKDIINSESQYIILEMGTSASENIEPALATVIKFNEEHGKRTIPIQEIALSVIYCSCEKDCNPSFDRKAAVLALKSQRLNIQYTENILALSTQTQKAPASDNEHKTLEVVEQTQQMEIENIVPKPLRNEDIITTTKNVLQVDETTNLKREIESSGESLFSTSKKMKLESARNVTGKRLEPTESTTEPPGKGKFTFKRDLNVYNEQSKPEVSNPFTMKRKVRETDVDNPAKRSIIDKTTDSSTPSSTKVINPFSLIKTKKPPYISNDTSIPSTSKSGIPSKSEQNIVSSTFSNSDISNSIRLDISAIVAVDSTLEKSHCWLSKIKNDDESKNITTTVSCLPPEEFDEHYIKFIESFKNVVVVKEESLVVRRTLAISNGLSSPNGSNFKKFKKVLPLKIQTTIVPESSYIRVTCNESCSVEAVHEDIVADNGIGIPSRIHIS